MGELSLIQEGFVRVRGGVMLDTYSPLSSVLADKFFPGHYRHTFEEQ
jgi:hypothetical protein